MAECIKTGANVYLQEYGVVRRSDLYRVGNCWLVRASSHLLAPEDVDRVHLQVRKIGHSFVDKDWITIIAEEDRCIYYGYEGRVSPRLKGAS